LGDRMQKRVAINVGLNYESIFAMRLFINTQRGLLKWLLKIIQPPKSK
jgi:hypothetical protein